MPSPPTMTGREVVKVFESLGWRVDRRNSAHIIMVKENEIASLSIPDHKEVAKGTLRKIIQAANLTVLEFNAAS